MTVTDNLLPRLMPAGVDQTELENVLHMHFGHATGPMDGQTIFLSTRDNQAVAEPKDRHSLQLTYNKNGVLRAIERGPGLSEAALREVAKKVRETLVVDNGTLVGAAILFSTLPVDAFWQHKGHLQILPVPKDAPRPSQPVGYHPFQIEFSFKNSPDWAIRNQRAYRKRKEFGLLLNAFLEGQIIVPCEGVKWPWVLVEETASPRKTKSVCAQEGYSFEGFKRERHEFTSPDGTPPLKAVRAGEFYSRFGLSRDDWELHRPEYLGDLFDRFFALPESPRQNFLTACFWFHHALHVTADSHSASYIALVQAIEALLPAGAGGACRECGQPKHKLAEQFENFLRTYAPYGDGIERGRKRLYKIRSELSHGRRLLSADIGAHWNWQDQPARDEMKQAVRVAFVNWLMRGPTP